MGLDITAYRQVQVVKDAPIDPDGNPCDDEHHNRIFVNPDYPGRDAGLDAAAIYTIGTEHISFGVGNYRSYNLWRNLLAKLAGYTYHPGGNGREEYCGDCWNGVEGPFSELISFSDCEGVIGPIVSAKLAKDFADFDDRAKAFVSNYRGFYQLYSEWHRAFEMAADGGYVNFH